MKLEYVKWIGALILFVLTSFFAFLPLWMLPKIRHNEDNRSRANYMRVVSLLSCCGGGVFLGTCLLHLFPDVRKDMSKVFAALHVDETFPVAEFLLAFGFLLILIVEQIVLTFSQQYEDTEREGLPFLGHQHSHDHDDHQTDYYQSSYGSVPDDDSSSNNENEKSFHKDQSSHSPLRSAILVLALSLHSVFEGLAIGLQSSSENVVRILAAVLIHKSIIAFTLGLNLTHSKFNKKIIVRCIAIFSFMSPFGTVTGSVISDIGSGLSVAISSGILQGIAAGTFVYVTFFEVLPHELNSKEDKMLKLLSIIIGFSAVSLLVLYLPT